MVRVAGLLDQVIARVNVRSPDGRTPQQALAEVRERVLELTSAQSKLWRDELVPGARRRGDRRRHGRGRDRDERGELEARFARQIYPVLTPLAVGPGQPFPYISGLSLSLGVTVRDPDSGEERFARVKVPETLPRFVAIGDRGLLIPLETVISHYLELGLPGDGADRARGVPRHARRRHRDLGRRRRPARGGRERAAQAPVRRGRAARGLELDLTGDGRAADRAARRPARRRLPGPRAARPARGRCSSTTSTGPTSSTSRGCRRPSGASRSRRTATCSPRSPRPTSSSSTRTTRSRRASRRFVRAAAKDPGRRDAEDDRVPHEPRLGARAGPDRGGRERQAERLHRRAEGALRRAAQHRVGALARAGRRPRRLRLPGPEDPREDDARDPARGRRRSSATSTSAPATTTRRPRGSTRTSGSSPPTRTSPPTSPTSSTSSPASAGRSAFRKILVAPFNLRRELVERIRAVGAAAAAGEHARIRIKVNNLADPEIVEELYKASQAGAEIDLIVRAVCVLRPGVEGLSRADPRALDPRPVPRAQPALLLRGRRREDLPARQRRPDAAQPRPPDRDGRPGRGARTCAPRSRRSSGAC